jgi:predicted metalloendopeptidase
MQGTVQPDDVYQARAASVFDIEKELQSVSLSPVQQRDPVATSNPIPYGKLQELMPEFDWHVYWSFVTEDAVRICMCICVGIYLSVLSIFI